MHEKGNLQRMKGRDKTLDSLKGLSILGIVLVHSHTTGELPTLARQIKAMGATSTIAFMLISVYLMLSSYEKLVIAGNDTQLRWFVSKLLRIAPMYYLFLILKLFLLGRGNINITIIANAITHFFFVNSLFPLFANSLLGVEWFIGAIVFFYLITPIMYKVFNNAVKSFCGLIVTSSIALCINHLCVTKLFDGVIATKRYYYQAWIGGWFPPVLLDVYCAGLLLFHFLKQKERISNMQERDRKILSFSLQAVFLIFFIADTIGAFRIWGISSRLISIVTYLTLIIALYIYPNNLIVNGAFSFLGKYTYGIFMSHVVIINLISEVIVCSENLVVDGIVKYCISLGGATIASLALTELYERPILKWIRITGEKNGNKKEE